MRLFLTGGAGQLGAAIRSTFDAEVIAPPHALLDIADPVAVQRAVGAAAPDAIINCAAFNDVDGAEERVVDAFAVNAFAVRSLARAAEDAGATLVHYSTDFVFDGAAVAPYDEDAVPAPQSRYGASKLLGEWFALEAPRAYVLRVESLFGMPRDWSGRRGSLDRIVAGLEAGDEVRVFTDRVVSPAFVIDVARATRHLIETAAAPGLYHCVNSGSATWEAIAREAASILGVPPRLQAIASDEASLKAKRPKYAALSTAKLAATGFPMPEWSAALRRWLTSREGGRVSQ